MDALARECAGIVLTKQEKEDGDDADVDMDLENPGPELGSWVG
jgi:hypothetical protein